MRFLFAAVLVVASAAHSYELKRDSTGEPVAWKTSPRFLLDPSLAVLLDADAAPAAVQAALRTVTEAVPALKLSASPGTSAGVGYDFAHPEASTSDVLAPGEWRWNVDAVATTVITVSRSTHQIIEADIAFNSQHTEFAVVAPGQASSRYDVQNAMTHELGHALGLAHNDLPETVMFPRSVPGEISKRALAADDLEGLRFLYGRPVPATVGEEQVPGCSTAGAGPLALLALVTVLLGRRRGGYVALAIGLAALGFANPVFAGAPVVQQGWTVSAVTTLPPGAGAAVLESEVTFVRGGQRQTRRVPGGRWGDVEQVVDGLSVPVVGETFLVVQP